jgi:hypothetical protein
MWLTICNDIEQVNSACRRVRERGTESSGEVSNASDPVVELGVQVGPAGGMTASTTASAPGWRFGLLPVPPSVTLPIHAAWRNQVQIYCSIVQRKALSPTASTRLMSSPIGCCAWASTTARSPTVRLGLHRADLERVLAKITGREPRLALAA